MITYLQVKIYSEKDESIFLPEACWFCESCVGSPSVVSMLCFFLGLNRVKVYSGSSQTDVGIGSREG